MDEEEEAGEEGTLKDRSSSPTSGEIDLLVHSHTKKSIKACKVRLYIGLAIISGTLGLSD